MQGDDTEDVTLARRIALDGGDRDAESTLCRRLAPRIRAYGLRHLRDDAAASDLAQHVVVVVLEALRARRVAEPERLAGFVLGVCRNTVIEWRKVERRRHALLETYARTLPAVALAGGTERTATKIDTDRLAHCLEELPPRDKTIIALTFFGDREPQEIAGELSMSLGNVRVARHRALARLHGCITRGEAS